MEARILRYTQEHKLSDIHIRSNQPVAIRVNGEIMTFPEDIITDKLFEEFINKNLESEQVELFNNTGDLDASVVLEAQRYRINVFKSMDGNCAVLRKIEDEIPDTDKIKIPATIIAETDAHSGLILVTGPTGSGKSTTLASMIKKINQSRSSNIITVEDPIEFIHSNIKSIISQREVGKHVESFAKGLKSALREDPDVVLVGELRDLETVSMALTAAETGHLVMGTLHTNGAPNTINRILDVFPPSQQNQARSQLSQSLRIVVTQQLLPTRDKQGRVAAYEIMKCNPAVQNLIREGKIFQIPSIMQTAAAEGMVTMEKSIENLRAEGKI